MLFRSHRSTGGEQTLIGGTPQTGKDRTKPNKAKENTRKHGDVKGDIILWEKKQIKNLGSTPPPGPRRSPSPPPSPRRSPSPPHDYDRHNPASPSRSPPPSQPSSPPPAPAKTPRAPKRKRANKSLIRKLPPLPKVPNVPPPRA